MEHTRVPTTVRIVATVVGIAITAAGCSGATATSAPAGTNVPPPGVDAAVTSSVAVDGSEAARVTPSRASVEPPVARADAASPATPAVPMPEHHPVPDADPDPATVGTADVPADGPERNTPAAPCGEFDPIPPLPDSMPTLMVDTDGDGAADDEATAYGAPDGWRVRVVEEGIVSEALVEGIDGWAHLAAPVPSPSGAVLELVAAGIADTWRFVTGPDHCVVPYELVAVDELVAVPPDPGTRPCGGLAPIPDDATVGTEVWRDIDDDGFADERLVSYFDGSWKVRGEVPEAGLASELEIPGAGVHGVRVLGFADVDHAAGGEEIVAVVGGGASTLEIGVFGFAEGYCLFRYQSDLGGDFGVFAGASIGHGDGVLCGDGYIVDWGYQPEDGDTYTVWSVAYETVEPGVFGDVPGSEAFVEGVPFDEIGTELFDCGGMAL